MKDRTVARTGAVYMILCGLMLSIYGLYMIYHSVGEQKLLFDGFFGGVVMFSLGNVIIIAFSLFYVDTYHHS